MEKWALSLSTSTHGIVIEQIVGASEEERKKNRELFSKLSEHYSTHYHFQSVFSLVMSVYIYFVIRIYKMLHTIHVLQ